MSDPRFGPAAPTADAMAALRPPALADVRLDPGGLLGSWQARNAEATIPHCVARLEEGGELDNMRRVTGQTDKPFTGMWFADSDIYKTLEAVAWAGTAQREFFDTATALLAKAQDEDGYLNSYIMTVEPQKRWQDLRWSHELYCAGHLIQAAVAARDTDLLAVARRFADHIVERFSTVEGVCGHPEIETALVELYRVTGHRPYLQTAQRFLDLRGHGLLGDDAMGRPYYQDHVPVRAAQEATGHAVRQLYLLAGMVDVAVETHDVELLQAAERLWDSAFGTKTYITGAHGSRHRDEAFGDPYELPPDRAYGETCAAIASFQWNWRMLLATGKHRYADEMERVLYNAIAASTSADGRHFFYSNPLHLRAGHDGSNEDAPSQRRPWYTCFCCPPNIARLMASLHGYVATHDQTGVQIHLYAEGSISHPRGRVQIRTGYPWAGRIELTVSGEGTLALRIPAWCKRFTVDGAPAPVQDGYVRLTREWGDSTTVVLELDLSPRVLAAHPHVDAVRGCVVLARGPLVYCLEQADLPGSVALEDVRLDVSAPIEATTAVPSIPVALTTTGTIRRPPAPDLYPEYETTRTASGAHDDVPLTAVPYFLWGNRAPGPMRVWVPLDRIPNP